MPSPTGCPARGFIAGAKMASPRIPKVASMARYRNVPAKMPDHDKVRLTGSSGYSVDCVAITVLLEVSF
jgi:hypothetical protein